MADILLIQPPIRDFYLTAKRTIPYGLACIASALMECGFSVEILDCLATSKSRVIPWPEEMSYLSTYYGKPDVSPFALFHRFKHYGLSFQHIGEVVRESGAFLIGISSLFTSYSKEAVKTAEVVKEMDPGCRLVMGGHHPTQMPEEVMGCEAVDYVLRGEGEVSMPAMAKALKNGSGVKDVPGIVFRRPDGKIEVNPPALMHRLDSYPLPATHLLDRNFYRRASKSCAVVTASRGCPMRCTYCSVGASSSIPYRRRSLQSVLCEIDKAVIEYGAGFIDFEDENISMEKQWFLDLLGAITARYGKPGVELRAMNGLFPPSLDREVIRAMKYAGFKTLNLSLGTISAEQLGRFQRPRVKEAFEEALSLAAEHGLDAVGYIIVGAPYQHATESVLDLLYLAGKQVLAGVSIYYPSPGSKDYLICRDAGILPQDFSLMRSSAIPISHTTTRDESVTLLRLGRILNFMKSLIDRDEALPGLDGFNSSNLNGLDAKDRIEAGKILLKAFLHDGAIRGITPEGKVFEHGISRELSTAFISGLTKIQGAGNTRLSPGFVEKGL
ncbi:MAG: B12-binding domain-containing radical SAM protein [Syntrophobacteraceae bacterium]